MTKFKTHNIKAYTFRGGAALITAALIATTLLFTACTDSSDASGGTPSTPSTPAYAADFVKITPLINGTAAPAPSSGSLPSNEDKWKGVFIAGRKVKLSPYALGKTEVTYELWYQVRTWAEAQGYTLAHKGIEGSGGTVGTAPTETGKNHPVTTISWRDCIVWCNAYTEMKMGESECVYRKSGDHDVVLKDSSDSAGADCDAAYADMDKKGFRLPTEAEWEYAARWQGSDNTNAVQYGDVWLTELNSASGAKDKWDTDETKTVAWYNGNSGGKTHPVGEKRANALGLYDMSGNVLEWCFDWYDPAPALNDDAYKSEDIVTDPQGPASGANRVERGGYWDWEAKTCTVGIRNSLKPDLKGISLGFRLAWRP